MKRRYRNVAFLTELLINIFIFSISCAILVGLFAQAAILSRKTREESFAGAEAYALLQTVEAQGVEALSGARQGDDAYVYYYDEKWAQASAENAAYQIEVTVTPEATGGGTLCRLSAVCSSVGGDEICRIETAVYDPAEGGGAA